MIAKGRFRDEVKLSEIGDVADHDIAYRYLECDLTRGFKILEWHGPGVVMLASLLLKVLANMASTIGCEADIFSA